MNVINEKNKGINMVIADIRALLEEKKNCFAKQQDRDELLRLKQISGLADLFANKDFSIPDNKPEYMP